MTQPEQQIVTATVGDRAVEIAALFHDTYERLAPSFGYETRPDTKKFDPNTPNGKLMIAVCGEVVASHAENARREERERAAQEISDLRHKLWMIACHATGGGVPEIEGIDRSTNDICVQISRHNNAIWKHAQEAAIRTTPNKEQSDDVHRI